MKAKQTTRTRLWLSVVGIGEEGYAALTSEARALCAKAQYILGASRHIASLPQELQARATTWQSPFAKNLTKLDALRDKVLQSTSPNGNHGALSSAHEYVCVLATGDPLSYGVGSVLLRRYGFEELRIVPWRGSFSLAASAMGWSHESFSTITLHGRPLALLRRYLAPCERLLVMLTGLRDISAVARLLCEEGLSSTTMTVLSCLGGEQESRSSFKAMDARGRSLPVKLTSPSLLALLALELPARRDYSTKPAGSSKFTSRLLGQKLGLADDAFFHDGQISKREVRALTIASLVVERDALLWDIGAGCGSISIEWCLGGGRACAIERDARRVALIAKNRESFGIPERLEILHTEAHDFLCGAVKDFSLAQKSSSSLSTKHVAIEGVATRFTAPQAIFLGGCLQLPLLERLSALLAARGRLVANAVTLDGENVLIEFYKKHGGTLTRIGVERLERIGSMDAFAPQRRILQYLYQAPDKVDS